MIYNFREECMKVIKRNGQEVVFNPEKIKIAVTKANNSVDELSKRLKDDKIENIVSSVTKECESMGRAVGVEEIQDMVELSIMKEGAFQVAKNYITYRYDRQLARQANTTDEQVFALIDCKNEEVKQENSNKNPTVNSVQRDYMAGEMSKDLTKRFLLPAHIWKAHEEGLIHFHDADYFAQRMHNCDLVNLEDMLQNGTVISNTMIERPHSFSTACNIATQIVAQVASSQYGGQSISLAHLAPFVEVSRQKIRKEVEEELKEACGHVDEELLHKITEQRVRKEINRGVQTIQYQVITLMTTNGQAPFVTEFLYLGEAKNEREREDLALIIEETLQQRYEGVKNEKGVPITPAFPKIIYVLEESNIHPDSKYYYLTELAAKCTAKRLVPDYISEKKMKELKEGNCFPVMGCRSALAPWKDENGNYKFEGRFNQGVVSINLPQVAIIADGDEDKFWKLLDERLELCKEALMCRHYSLVGTHSDISPIHWQYGAIARLQKGEKIDKLLYGGYSTISLGYIGIYEMTKLMKGVSHTTPEGHDFALRVMKHLRETTDRWKKETNIGFALYGTPAESLCYKFARIDKERFGTIKDVTDKGYYTNSYHVDVRERIVKFIYDNIQYAEFNTKSDYCHVCGFDGEIMINDDNEWECPNCGNKDHSKMTVVRRTCGYLGENFWNTGKTKEIKQRVMHL